MPPMCHILCVQCAYTSLLTIPQHMGFYYYHFTHVETKGRKAKKFVHGPVGKK